MAKGSGKSSARFLTVTNHDRNFSKMKYVYPVVSRRSKGVSIGINLSPNSACNWRCEYCQVPDLARGASPAVDWQQFKAELEQVVNEICHGSFLADHVAPESQVLRDFALSGNGEPTSCPDFPEVVKYVASLRERHGLIDTVKIVLITNGSLVHQASVRQGLETLCVHNGEAWFKLDRGSDFALATTNGTAVSIARHLARLHVTSKICRTWVQSCWYTKDSETPSSQEVDAFIDCMAQSLRDGATPEGVQLYTLARKPLLPEGSNLGPVAADWLAELAARLSTLGLCVRPID